MLVHSAGGTQDNTNDASLPLPLLLPSLLPLPAADVPPVTPCAQVATQFFGLQVVIVFLASFISGTVFNQLALLLSNPEKVLMIIGTGDRRRRGTC